ncbi:MAG: response regulator [Deltaproteobacteria bacterium]|nr:MAG: response regulator [Deltaproteobacteria bacterium]
MKILVVDDSKAVRKIVKNMLKNLGYEVYEAENGEKALELLYEHDWFDLILLDWNMPEMDGYEFLKIVKKNPKWRNIKIMMVTSENQQQSVLEALNAGADEYLMKPFDQKMLLTKIEMVMEGI